MPAAIEWIEDASEPQKTLRKMVVAWETVRYLLSKTVLSFNEEYFEKEKPNDMEKIAMKRMVIAALFEIKPKIDGWYKDLDDRGLLSKRSAELKIEKRKIIDQARKFEFENIRNLTFHYGDPTEDTESLLDLYKKIDAISIGHLNLILRSLSDIGESLWKDVCEATGVYS